ncbi:DNA cytosine methyltransferase [Micromonospora sp. NBC_00421]|uniref:DNA cytosine methyltransferase n=1 Tax=Micromonospora sp. NBC_00421 TaxID=2975976 RepID=UPI002E20999F
MTPRAIELFCGCGGLSTGILDAGIQVLAGFDHDAPSIKTFNYNHQYRGGYGYVADLASLSGKELLELANVRGSVDLVAGGPPCQPFSVAGKKRGLDDKRGNLIFRFADIVRELSPTAFLFENVPNLAKMDGGSLAGRLKDELSALGYEVYASILTAADYGVPQARKRFFLVGLPTGMKFAFPAPTHAEKIDLFGETKPYLTAADAIGDLPDVGTDRAREIPNHEPTMHSAKMVQAFRELLPGTRDKKSFHDRLHPDRLSYTLRAGSGNFSPLRPVHYKYDRVISVRESARIQGMDDSFIWPDPLPRLQQYRQVGNAVPPPLAQAVAARMADVLGWEASPHETKGDPSTRPAAFYLTHEERHADRVGRLRGASLGAPVSPQPPESD